MSTRTANRPAQAKGYRSPPPRLVRSVGGDPLGDAEIDLIRDALLSNLLEDVLADYHATAGQRTGTCE
jgi:hypothetical protein